MRHYFILLLLFSCNPVAANYIFTDSSNLNLNFTAKKWGLEDGLPGSAITDILLADNHYVWVSTYDGLARFDGYSFDSYTQKKFKEITTNSLECLAEDRTGDIYIGTNGGGVLRYHNGKIIPIKALGNLPNLTVTCLLPTLNGIWVGTRGGLSFLHQANYINAAYLKPLLGKGIQCLLQEANGDLLIGTASNGLYKLAGQKLTQVKSSHGTNFSSIKSLYKDRSNTIWIGTETGLGQLVKGEIVAINPFKDPFKTFVNCITEDNNGTIWFATNRGLVSYLNNKFELITEASGQSLAHVQVVRPDNDGNLWLGLYRKGLVKLRQRIFQTYNSGQGLPNNTINVVYPDSHGAWIGTDNGLARIISGEVKNFYLPNVGESSRVRDVAKTHTNDIWVATYGGLFKLEESGKFRPYPLGKNNSVQDKVRKIYEDDRGTLWIGSRNGLYKSVEKNNPAKFEEIPEFTGKFILDINQSADGAIWVTTNGYGIYKSLEDRTIWQNFSAANENISSDVVFSILPETSGDLWFGTNNGITLYKNGNWYNRSGQSGFFTNTVFQILQDKDYNYWITSNLGLYKISELNLQNFVLGKTNASPYIKKYTANEGMLSTEIASVSKSALDQHGYLWVSGLDGLSVLNTKNTIVNSKAPQITVSEIIIDNTRHVDFESLGDIRIELPEGTQHITLKYTGFNYTAPEKIKFKYKLAGFDRDWIDAGNDRQAHYTNLPAGNYDFLIKAANEDGVWTAKSTSIPLVQVAYMHQTLQFRILVFLILLVLFTAAYKLRTHHLNRINKRLSRLVADRTKSVELQKQDIENQKEELDKLNSIKDRILSVLSHDLRQPFTSTIGLLTLLRERQIDQTEFVKFAAMLNQQVKGQVHMLDNILHWTKNQLAGLVVHKANFNFYKFSQELINIYTPQAAEKSIKFSSNVPLDYYVWADEDIVHIIIRNLLSNAIKFTPNGGTILLNVIKQHADYEISVSDNGIGMSEEQIVTLFTEKIAIPQLGTKNEKGTGLGLVICQEFAMACGGKLVVESKLNNGSKFSLLLPINDEFVHNEHYIASGQNIS